MSCASSFCNADLTSIFERSGGPVVKHIGIVLYDGFSLVGVGTLIEALHIANELQASAEEKCLTYSVSLLSARGGIVACSSSICVCTEHLSAQRSCAFDALYVAGGTGVTRASADDSLIELLKTTCSHSSTISALGSGHALLTAAGLSCDTCGLLGRDIFTRDNPRDERSHALIYALALLKRDLGYDIASSAAERLLENQHVSIIVSEMGTPSAAEKTQASARWLARNCGKPVSVVDAAHTASMSGRNFHRLFKREMGLTPSQYLLHARLKLSCELLTNSELPIDKIARRTGLSNGERLSKLFRKQFSMSPTEYRARKREGSSS
jgi:transcriptional regulator GlxA family with amidase domain